MSAMRPVELRATCRSLRHKLMYVDARQATPGLADDSSETRVFFCVRTQDALGPDGAAVSPRECTASRNCYCGDGGA